MLRHHVVAFNVCATRFVATNTDAITYRAKGNPLSSLAGDLQSNYYDAAQSDRSASCGGRHAARGFLRLGRGLLRAGGTRFGRRGRRSGSGSLDGGSRDPRGVVLLKVALLVLGTRAAVAGLVATRAFGHGRTVA